MLTINSDTLRERIRERLEESGNTCTRYCWACQAALTVADCERGRCTQCGAEVEIVDEVDESVDEDFYED